MIAKRYFLNLGCELLIEENPKHRVLMVEPEKLEKVSADDIWGRLLCCFGKYEVENWVAESIVDISIKAAAEGAMADFSKISQVEVIYGNEGNWKTAINKEKFKNLFCSLPIFRVLKESEDVTILEYIPKIR